jgi:hypothetical protein
MLNPSWKDRQTTTGIKKDSPENVMMLMEELSLEEKTTAACQPFIITPLFLSAVPE